MDKEQQPNQKPISKQIQMRIFKREKTQNQVKQSSRKKTHTYYLKILSWKEATMEFENGYTERLGRRQLREKMNSHKKFEGKLKKI